MQEAGIFVIDKSLLFAGGPVPKDIAMYINPIQYTEIYKQVQQCHLSAQNWACCMELGCCCVGLYLLHCVHMFLANAAFDRMMPR
jgi:hypothetical protein